MAKRLEEYPNRIREFRLANDMTQQQLADVVGMSAVNIGHLELGRRDINLSNLRMIAKVFGVPTATLLSARDNPKG
ncbi:MAG: XRE family transcriptional regulator [Alphaproteobacteria bacterium HGW-Alphaproteobacteria-7]|jgi:transcriptional regulator with XRE-family HTH domain|nr:MAG: XRE family transcriptional regulator [Alphaproteobacteria bacterium HGW-Alphaproteobacteria-7]